LGQYLRRDTDINSWHFYISDYRKAQEHIGKVVKPTFKGPSFHYVPGFGLFARPPPIGPTFPQTLNYFNRGIEPGWLGQPDPAVVPDRAFRLFGLRVLNVTLKGRILFSE